MLRKPEIYLIPLFLIIAVIIYTLFFTHLSILKYLSFFSFDADSLAEDNNLLFHTSSGKFFYQSLGERLFNSDFSFFYIFIALIYKFFPHIYTLFVLRHFVLAIGIFPIYWLSQQKFNSKIVAVLFAISYLLFNPLHHLSFVDNASLLVPFATTFILFAFYFLFKEKLVEFILFSLLAVICKEESAFIICMFATFAFIKKMSLRWKIIPIFLSLIYLLIIWLIIMPLLARTTNYAVSDNAYINTLFGNNPQKDSIIELFFYNHREIVKRLMSFSRLRFNLNMLAKTFNPKIYFMSLFAPEILILSFPVFVTAQLACYKHFLCTELVHHVAYLLIFIYLGALLGIHRMIAFLHNKKIFPHFISLKSLYFLSGGIFFIFTLLSNFQQNIFFPPSGIYRSHKIVDERFISIKNMYNPVFYTQDRKDKMAWEFIRLIPKDASVSTTVNYLAALSSREKIYHFGCRRDINLRDGHDFDAEYVFLNKIDEYNGFGGLEVNHTKVLEELPLLSEEYNYEIIKENEEFILLRKRINL